MRVVKVLETLDVVSPPTGKPQQRRVLILQRDDGFFSLAQEYFYVSEWEGKVFSQGWRRLGSASSSIYATAEMAEAEGRVFLRSLRHHYRPTPKYADDEC